MTQYPSSFEQSRPLSTGLAVGALVCALVGLCVPGLGLVGLILGIVALMKASSSPQTHGGQGMAIAGVIVGALSLVWVVIVMLNIGIMLPALGKAREAARQLKSSTQLRMIDQAMQLYAVDNKGWLPEAGADWQSRINIGDTSMFVSPRAGSPTATDSYIYIPGFNIDQLKNPSAAIILYENPKYVPRGMICVAYADGRVEAVPVAQLQQTLDAAVKPGQRPKAPAPRGGG